MKNIFLFIQRYFIFICFIILQVVCIILLSNSSKTHQAFFAGAANEVTGKIDKQYTDVREYLNLKEVNRQLNEENARLKNMLSAGYTLNDTNRIVYVDTLNKDTSGHSRKFTYLPARVVGNSVSQQNNYIMLERGGLQGVRKGQSVVGPQGIVGVVTDTAPNFSKVMSLLNRNSRVSGMLKSNQTTGDVEWDGVDPHYLIMKKVSKSAKVKKGDTVLTSTFSSNFPPFLPVGFVTEITPDPTSSFLTLKIKTATDFFSIQYVNVVDNVRYAEQEELQNRKDAKEQP